MRLIPKLRITRIAAAFLAVAWLFGTAASAQMSSRMSTRFLARGEQALLEVAVTGGQPVAFPEIPAAAGKEAGIHLRIPGFQL
jgi:hypothetical protein